MGHFRNCRLATVTLIPLTLFCGPGRAADTDDSDAVSDAKKPPNIYFDFSTTMASSPPGVISLGRRPFSLQAGSGSQSLTFSAPFTIDITDHFSIYTGPQWSTSKSSNSAWTPVTPGDWTSGFSADVISSDAVGPTLTLSGSVARPIKPPPLFSYTTWSGGLALDYSLNEDQTRGFLVNFNVTHTIVEKLPATVRPVTVLSVGAYNEWANDWKLTGNVGVQLFRGATIANLVNLKPVTQPFVSAAFERYDDNDNRLFGVTVALGWSPKPSVQVTLNTPLYFIRN